MPINHFSEFFTRRQSLMQKVGQDAVIIVSAAREICRNGDSHYAYRQNSNFYYLTGFPEPEAIAVFICNENKYILFNRPKDPAKELWDGRRAGQTGACEDYGADESHSIHEFESRLPALLAKAKRVCFAIGQHATLEHQIVQAMNTLRTQARLGHQPPFAMIDLEHYVHEMRLFKSPTEIAWMKKAAHISSEAHKVAMRACRVGMYEYELEAELLREFYRRGARAQAYNAIVGSGKNTCVLHYNQNSDEIKKDDLILIDAGCEYQYYASDITRTFPASGRFSSEQAAIYKIVLEAQLAAIQAVKPGVTWDTLQAVCIRVITQGLIDLNLLKGRVDDLIAERAYLNFYMHNSGHWLGMDVHDPSAYKLNDHWRELAPGMVFTVEPGIYIAANHPQADERWWNIGVRIEDDLLVTETGSEILSAELPKEIAAIEAWMNQ